MLCGNIILLTSWRVSFYGDNQTFFIRKIAHVAGSSYKMHSNMFVSTKFWGTTKQALSHLFFVIAFSQFVLASLLSFSRRWVFITGKSLELKPLSIIGS